MINCNSPNNKSEHGNIDILTSVLHVFDANSHKILFAHKCFQTVVQSFFKFFCVQQYDCYMLCKTCQRYVKQKLWMNRFCRDFSSPYWAPVMHNNVKELGHHWFQARACYVKMIELFPISLLRTYHIRKCNWIYRLQNFRHCPVNHALQQNKLCVYSCKATSLLHKWAPALFHH